MTFQDYQTRLIRLVITVKDYSNYYGLDVNSKIDNDAHFILDNGLDGYSGYEVTLKETEDEANDRNVKVLMYQKWDANGEGRKVIGHTEDIERGNLVFFDNEYWLMTTKPEDNRVYRKAEITFCSFMFELRNDDIVTITGRDDLDRPIKKVTKGTVKHVPAVVKMNDASTAIADQNQPINELANIVTLTIPYRESDSLKHDKTFVLYGMTYRIIRIDYSKSLDKVGIIKITGEMLGEPSEG